MAQFEQFQDKLLALEGGYDHSIVNGTYQNKYWDAHRLGELESQMMAEIICDAIIEHGTGSSYNKGGITILQQSLNEIPGELIPVNGLLGSITLAAINRQTRINLARIYNSFRKKRIEYYYEKAINPDQAAFLSSWLDRMEQFPELDPVFSNAMAEKQERAEQINRGLDEVVHFFKGILSIHKSQSAQREWGIAILIVGLVVFLLIQNKRNYLP